MDDSKILNFKVDYSTNKSVRNWIEQYDIGCVSKFELGLIGSMFLLGAWIGSFILPRLADVKGRKPMFLIGLVLYIISVLGLLFSTNKYVMYVLLVLAGVSETGRYYVAYVYANEILPSRLQNLGGLTIFISFSTTKVLICLYFMFSAERTWKVLGYIAIGFAVISFLLTTFMLPESPRWLVG